MVKLRKRTATIQSTIEWLQLILKGVRRQPSVQDKINILSSADAKSLSVQ